MSTILTLKLRYFRTATPYYVLFSSALRLGFFRLLLVIFRYAAPVV